MKLQIVFHQNCYRSESISDKEWTKITMQLRCFPRITDVYLVTPASNHNDLLEIFHSKQLCQKYCKRKKYMIVGVAKTYDESLALIEKMTQDCLSRRGDCALREYLLC